MVRGLYRYSVGKNVWAMLQRFITSKNILISFATDISESTFHVPGEREKIITSESTAALPVPWHRPSSSDSEPPAWWEGGPQVKSVDHRGPNGVPRGGTRIRSGKCGDTTNGTTRDARRKRIGAMGDLEMTLCFLPLE